MKASLILLVIAIALLAVGICLDGLPGIAICAAANACSLTALVREVRRGRKLEVNDDERDV